MNQATLFASMGDIELEPYLFPPDAVVSADLKARGWSVMTEDEHGCRVTTGIFETGAGTIRNRIHATETIYVLEGTARIELETGQVLDLSKGDVALLPRGPVATWTFGGPFRELFIVSGVTA